MACGCQAILLNEDVMWCDVMMMRVHSSEWRATKFSMRMCCKVNTVSITPVPMRNCGKQWGVSFIGGVLYQNGEAGKNTVLVCSQHPLKQSILNTIQFRSKRLDRINLHRGKSNTRNWIKKLESLGERKSPPNQPIAQMQFLERKNWQNFFRRGHSAVVI